MSGRWRRRPDLLERDAPEGRLVLPAAGDEVTILGGTSVALWGLLEQPRTVEELVIDLTDRYGGDHEQVTLDVRCAVDELVARGLVDER